MKYKVVYTDPTIFVYDTCEIECADLEDARKEFYKILEKYPLTRHGSVAIIKYEIIDEIRGTK